MANNRINNPVVKLAQFQKAQIAKGQDKMTLELIRNWAKIQKHLSSELDKVLKEIADNTLAGMKPTPGQVYSSQRFKTLLQQADGQLSKYSADASGVIRDRQAVLVPRAIKNVNDLAGAVVKNGAKAAGVAEPSLVSLGWNYINPNVVEGTVELLKPGSVYYEGLQKIAPDAVDKLRDSIITRVTTGEQPEQVLKAFQGDLAGKMASYIRIARTSTMEAYRETQTETQNQNSDVISGWRWTASLSGDTCSACLALNGQEFKTGENMDSHWSCNCSQISIIKGFPPIKMQSGQAWLKSQSADTQRRALGTSKYEAFRDGKIQLSDLVAKRHDGRGAEKFMESSLKEALAKAGK